MTQHVVISTPEESTNDPQPPPAEPPSPSARQRLHWRTQAGFSVTFLKLFLTGINATSRRYRPGIGEA